MFTKVGETYYAEIYADGSTWNGEFYIGCDGGRNRGEGDTAGSVTIAFDNIMITDTAAVTYADTVETFDRGDFTGDTAIVNTFKENPMMESDLLTVTANRANFFAIRNEITAGTASSYGDAAPWGRRGNIFRWCTSRILDKDTDFSVPSADGGAQGLVHQTLTIRFKEGKFDPAKGYTVTIPVMFAQHDISVEGQALVPGAEGISIEAYDAASGGTLLNEGNTYLFDAKTAKGCWNLRSPQAPIGTARSYWSSIGTALREGRSKALKCFRRLRSISITFRSTRSQSNGFARPRKRGGGRSRV